MFKKLYSIIIISIMLISSVSAKELYYWTDPVTLKRFTYEQAIKLKLDWFIGQLDWDKKNQANLIYKRKLDWKLTTLDNKIMKDYCHWNTKCINEDFWPSMQLNYEKRDRNLNTIAGYLEVVQNKYNVLKWTEKPFQFIETKYWKNIYDKISKYKVKIDKYFNAYIAKEKQLVLDWKYSTLLDKTLKPIAITTFWMYILEEGHPKLEKLKNKQSSDLWKAVYNYFQYLLLNDDKLYVSE